MRRRATSPPPTQSGAAPLPRHEDRGRRPIRVPHQREMKCRGEGTFTTPGGQTFEEFVQAFVSELTKADPSPLPVQPVTHRAAHDQLEVVALEPRQLLGE